MNHGSVRQVEIRTNTAYAFPGGLIQHRVYGRNAKLSEGTRFTIVAFYTKSWMMIFETWTGAFEGTAKKQGLPRLVSRLHKEHATLGRGGDRQ